MSRYFWHHVDFFIFLLKQKLKRKNWMKKLNLKVLKRNLLIIFPLSLIQQKCQRKSLKMTLQGYLRFLFPFSTYHLVIFSSFCFYPVLLFTSLSFFLFSDFSIAFILLLLLLIFEIFLQDILSYFQSSKMYWFINFFFLFLYFQSTWVQSREWYKFMCTFSGNIDTCHRAGF